MTPVARAGRLLSLAWPVMLSRAGILLMAFADVAMLGRFAPGAVGAASLGLSIFVPLLVISIGLCQGLIPVVAREHGAGRRAETGRAWRRGLVWASLVSLPAMAACWHGEALLRLFGQDPALVAEGGRVARVLTPALWAQTLFAVSSFYLEATERPRIVLAVMFAANLLNIALDAVLIFGAFGLPALGATGSALATTSVYVAASAVLAAVILRQGAPVRAGVRGRWRSLWGPGGWLAGRPMRRLGYAAGLGTAFETTGFAAMMQFAGLLGTVPLDAYAISHNLVGTVFMVGVGLSVATGVRVGGATGRGDPAEAAAWGWTGAALAVLVMGSLAATAALFPGAMARIYTDEPRVGAAAAVLISASALIFVVDALQAVLGQCLRAVGDVWVPVAVYAGSFFVLMVPLGWVLSQETPLGAIGLPVAISVGCAVASGLLALRFRRLTRQGRGDDARPSPAAPV